MRKHTELLNEGDRVRLTANGNQMGTETMWLEWQVHVENDTGLFLTTVPDNGFTMMCFVPKADIDSVYHAQHPDHKLGVYYVNIDW